MSLCLKELTPTVRHLNHPSVVRAYSSFLDPRLSSLFLTVEPVLPCYVVTQQRPNRKRFSRLKEKMEALWL
ncbi:hypothetical protein SprV_0301059300 [Sparganum proliferum]